MYQPSVVKDKCVSFFESIFECVCVVLEQIGKPLESGIEFFGSREGKRCLLGRGVIDMGDFSTRRGWCWRCKCDREVVLVYMMTVVNIME